MAKIVTRNLNKTGGKSGLTTKVSVAEGRALKIQSVDANSGTFSGDLLRAFTRNVARHRRDNKTAAKKA